MEDTAKTSYIITPFELIGRETLSRPCAIVLCIKVCANNAPCFYILQKAFPVSVQELIEIFRRCAGIVFGVGVNGYLSCLFHCYNGFIALKIDFPAVLNDELISNLAPCSFARHVVNLHFLSFLSFVSGKGFFLPFPFTLLLFLLVCFFRRPSCFCGNACEVCKSFLCYRVGLILPCHKADAERVPKRHFLHLPFCHFFVLNCV